MRPFYIYLTMCIAGVAVPYSQIVPWIVDHGLNVPLMIERLTSSRVTLFFALDVVVATFVLWIFTVIEWRRGNIRHGWAPIVASIVVGVSLALPLLLLLREWKKPALRPESRLRVVAK